MYLLCGLDLYLPREILIESCSCTTERVANSMIKMDWINNEPTLKFNEEKRKTTKQDYIRESEPV